MPELTNEELADIEKTIYHVRLTCPEFAALIRYFNYGLRGEDYKRHLSKYYSPSLSKEMFKNFDNAIDKFIHNATEIKPKKVKYLTCKQAVNDLYSQ
jgi:hypothetical protein